jgi:hypothetical protein
MAGETGAVLGATAVDDPNKQLGESIQDGLQSVVDILGDTLRPKTTTTTKERETDPHMRWIAIGLFVAAGAILVWKLRK